MKIDLEKLSQEEWQLEHFDGYPAFTVMTGFGFTKKRRDHIPVYGINFCHYKKNQGDWITLLKDQQIVGSKIVSIFMEHPSRIEKSYQEWKKQYSSVLSFFDNNFALDILDLDRKGLWKWAKQVYDFYQHKVVMPGFIDGFMYYADKRLDKLLRDYCTSSGGNPVEMFSILGAPIDPSFFNIEENDLKKIAKTLSEGNADAADHQSKTLVSNHAHKYAWLRSGYYGYKRYSEEEIAQRIAEIQVKKNFEPDLGFKENQRIKNKLLSEHKFSLEILAITRLTELYIKWQDERKVYTLTFAALQEKILQRTSDLSGISIDLLKYCEVEDSKKILFGKNISDVLEVRKESCLFCYVNGATVLIITGKEADDFLRKISPIHDGDATELKGMVASTGVVQGKVRVIMSISQIDKLCDGDILVAPMTRPEHLAGMKRAAAIVTDDGGITCHAAIVARELKKPCIIGTKFATKVFKDGDIVEVDADKGIVKIISN